MFARPVTVAAVSIACLAALPASSSAAPIRECGNHVWVDDLHRVAWVMDIDRISGAGTFNVTSRKVGCKVALNCSGFVGGSCYWV